MSLNIADTILRNRTYFFGEIRGSAGLGYKIQSMMLSCFIFLAIYGAVMGAAHSPLQALSSAVKLPILFLATLTICTPSLHFFNILFGSKQTLGQTVSLILTAMSTTSVILVSFAPITFFFLVTTRNYPFFLVLNVVFFAVAGAMARRTVFTIWILLYAFVGSQIAYTLSPFVGDPGQPFILFTQYGDNFYSYVLTQIVHLLRMG